MPQKSKYKKNAAAKPGTLKEGAKQPAQKRQPPADFSPNLIGKPSVVDNEPNLNAVMDLLVDISSRLSTNE